MLFLEDFVIIDVDLGLLIDYNLLPKKSLTTKLSYRFMMACRSGDYSTVKKSLENDNYLVYQYDSVPL